MTFALFLKQILIFYEEPRYCLSPSIFLRRYSNYNPPFDTALTLSHKFEAGFVVSQSHFPVYRRIHDHTYKHELGMTNPLTITHLEQIAAKPQSYLA